MSSIVVTEETVVAPVWVRGLKLAAVIVGAVVKRRTRMGAWIETLSFRQAGKAGGGRTRMGAWIET